MGWMTGFELNRTHRHINNINRIARQIAAKQSKKSANLQPVATRILTVKTRLHPRGMTHERTCSLPAHRHHITQIVCVSGQRTLHLALHKNPSPAEIVLQVRGTDCTQETLALYDAAAPRVNSQASMVISYRTPEKGYRTYFLPTKIHSYRY